MDSFIHSISEDGTWPFDSRGRGGNDGWHGSRQLGHEAGFTLSFIHRKQREQRGVRLSEPSHSDRQPLPRIHFLEQQFPSVDGPCRIKRPFPGCHLRPSENTGIYIRTHNSGKIVIMK